MSHGSGQLWPLGDDVQLIQAMLDYVQQILCDHGTRMVGEQIIKLSTVKSSLQALVETLDCDDCDALNFTLPGLYHFYTDASNKDTVAATLAHSLSTESSHLALDASLPSGASMSSALVESELYSAFECHSHPHSHSHLRSSQVHSSAMSPPPTLSKRSRHSVPNRSITPPISVQSMKSSYVSSASPPRLSINVKRELALSLKPKAKTKTESKHQRSVSLNQRPMGMAMGMGGDPLMAELKRRLSKKAAAPPPALPKKTAQSVSEEIRSKRQHRPLPPLPSPQDHKQHFRAVMEGIHVESQRRGKDQAYID